jgi:hypothetical protein
MKAAPRPFEVRSSWLLAQTADQVAALSVVQQEIDRRSGGYPALSYSWHAAKPHGFFGPTALKTNDLDPFVTLHRTAPLYSHSTVTNAVAMPLDQESAAHVQTLNGECTTDAGLSPDVCASIAALQVIASLPSWWDGDGAAPWYCDGDAFCQDPGSIHLSPTVPNNDVVDGAFTR